MRPSAHGWMVVVLPKLSPPLIRDAGLMVHYTPTAMPVNAYRLVRGLRSERARATLKAKRWAPQTVPV